ncbi:unnamed protein product [Cylindrotheca closterium]|uniref:Sialate O-acetylesterase domain-containing protein n=1 Tax=Cylindrotheca closterium TaxID=2856 RepID=A0AAD2FSW1_9STRA|nr:unnamed protein product [Cylindrotheca closterium]
MEGHGEIDKRDDNGLLMNGTLLYQLHDPRTRDEFQVLWDTSRNTWKSLPNVQIWFQEAMYEAGVNGTNIPGINGQDYSAGDLTVGYGEGGSARSEFFGPELGFGFHLDLPPGSSTRDKILLVKTAWGGKDLAQDFRPPSSAQEFDPFCLLPECDPFSVGHYYNVMLQDVNKLLKPGVLGTIFPQYTNMTVDVAGFVWFQGWNDGCSVNYTAAYETNLVHLIQDMRYALRKPKLPVLVGVSGFEGWRDNGQGRKPTNCWDGPNIIDRIHCDCSGFDRECRRIDIMLSQIEAANLTKHPELGCCVESIETRDFFRAAELSPMDQGYHFNHNAETHFLIGKAMARGMNRLQAASTDDSGMPAQSL